MIDSIILNIKENKERIEKIIMVDNKIEIIFKMTIPLDEMAEEKKLAADAVEFEFKHIN